MPASHKLLTFALRALALLVALSLLWLPVAGRYNEALAWIVRPVIPDSLTLTTAGVHLVFRVAGQAPWSLDGLALHYGPILMAVLVLAAVGIRPAHRTAWLLAVIACGFLVHVAGVIAMAYGLEWISAPESPAYSRRLVLSLFAVFWGLLPAVAGGAWCLLYWLPRAAQRHVKPGETPGESTP